MLEQRGNCRGGEKWPNSGYILKLEVSECANGLNAGYEERGIKDNSKVVGLRNWKDGVSIY